MSAHCTWNSVTIQFGTRILCRSWKSNLKSSLKFLRCFAYISKSQSKMLPSFFNLNKLKKYSIQTNCVPIFNRRNLVSNPIMIVRAWITAISFMPHCVKSGLPNIWSNEIWSVTARDPQNDVPSEKVWEPMFYGFFCLGCKDWDLLYFTHALLVLANLVYKYFSFWNSYEK